MSRRKLKQAPNWREVLTSSFLFAFARLPGCVVAWLQYLRGNVPTFADPQAFEGAMDATPSSVYTGKAADPLTERLKVELERVRGTVREKETVADSAREVNFDLIRRGLMSNAGQSSSHSFCIEGNPL